MHMYRCDACAGALQVFSGGYSAQVGWDGGPESTSLQLHEGSRCSSAVKAIDYSVASEAGLGCLWT